MNTENESSGYADSLRFVPEIEDVYSAYMQKIPLDLTSGIREDIQSWQQNNQLSRIKFARLVQGLMSAETLDEFVKVSSADFDNLGPILEIAMRLKLISVDSAGHIERVLKIKDDAPITTELSRKTIDPLSEFNQFPCDLASRMRRVDLFKERYPNIESLRIAIIGDDDLLSVELSQEKWAKVVVLEKDPRIVTILRDASPASRIIESDVNDLEDDTINNSADTFITDPPYTLHGSLSFIVAGLKFLQQNEEEKEFYVVLNPTMMGRHIDTLNQLLCSSNIFLKEVRPNFSQYKLPENFNEKSRAAMFLEGNLIDPNALQYSSSSSLYIFSTHEPDICKLGSYIHPQLIYTHYL